MRDPLSRAARSVRFGGFEMDLRSGELRHGGKTTLLQEQPFRVLALLIESAGDLVTRERLRRELWPEGTHVDFELSLNAAVRRLRAVLRDSAVKPRFIQTLPRRGYRFIAPIQPVTAPAARQNPSAGVAHPRSVAVLPFEDLAPETGSRHFADGVTEDIITHLSRIHGLHVISRTSATRVSRAAKTLQQIGARLRVAMVVEGTVRRSGKRVRVTARLVDTATEEQAWSASFDRELGEVFDIQTEVALEVAGALRVEVTQAERARLARRATSDFAAYELYLQGRHCFYQFTEHGLRQSIELYERAIACDPAYALPYVGLAFAYTTLGDGHGSGTQRGVQAYARARAAIDRALALDPELGDAHGIAAALRALAEYDWTEAEHIYTTAVQLNPVSVETLITYALMLSTLERYDEALAVQRRTHELDPLAPLPMSDMASTLLRAGRSAEAEAVARELVVLEPGFPMGHSTLGWALLKQGRVREGIAEIERASSSSPGSTLFLGQLGEACALAGDTARAREILGRMETMSRERYVSPYHLAYVHTGLGDVERALDCLERAVEERAGGVYGMRGSFLFTSLRGHPRFVALLERMNLA